ncbi:MAG: response regulator transcription factor [Myxococcaceae bacterium]
MSTISVLIVEDQPAMLKNLSRLIETSQNTQLSGTAMSAEEAIVILDQLEELPNVILCDIGLPRMSGTDFCRFVKVKYPEIQLLMLTVFDDDEQVLEAVKRGAAGYLLKGIESQKILETISEIHEGGSVIQPGLARKLLQHFKQASLPHNSHSEPYRRSLTERELECLQMIAKGLSNIEAASVLGLSKATVRTHLEHIYQKLDVCNRVEAVTEGLRQGLIGI